MNVLRMLDYYIFQKSIHDENSENRPTLKEITGSEKKEKDALIILTKHDILLHQRNALSYFVQKNNYT